MQNKGVIITWVCKSFNLYILLGIFVGTNIFVTRMKQHLTCTLEVRLQQARLNSYSLSVRVLIANQMVNSMIWYMLQLSTDTVDELKRFDNLIKDFVWSGQEFSKCPRVDYQMLMAPIEEGGWV